MKINQKNVLVLAMAAAAVMGTASANAAGAAIDVTDVVSTIALQLTPINAVGVGVLGLTVAVKAYQWVRRALG